MHCIRLHHRRLGLGRFGHGLSPRARTAGTRSWCSNMAAPTWGPLIQMPSALSYPMNMKPYDWGFVSEPEPALGGRRLVTPRGKVIGGSSSINGMVYVRGHARDFDTWEEMGARGWGYRHVLPYFKRMETSHGGEEGWRGTDGPLHVTRGSRRTRSTRPSSRPAARRAIPSPRTTMATSRKASAPWR